MGDDLRSVREEDLRCSACGSREGLYRIDSAASRTWRPWPMYLCGACMGAAVQLTEDGDGPESASCPVCGGPWKELDGTAANHLHCARA